jgi:succinate dehydrogenase/fumarate reductase flavoprotein subunit
MRVMRRVVRRAGVRVLDQSPALELLADADGVGGARGIDRLDGRTFEVRAPAVILATGGCTFLSKTLGSNVLTGEGLLMAAEVGAELSGMEFNRMYGASARFATVPRNRMLTWATLTNEDGDVIGHGTGDLQDILAHALLDGPVYAVLDRADTAEKRAMLRRSHAIFFVPYDRAGIDPFTQRFPLTLRYEGTMRGTGGIRITGDGCETGVPGLYAAGDAASRERSHGAATGGGALNASWAICSGRWSGAAAARYAATVGTVRRSGLRPMGRAGLRPVTDGAMDTTALVEAVQRDVLPLDVSYFRSVPVFQAALARLGELWPAALGTPETGVRGRVRSREAAALTAVARWMHTASLSRLETRGLHSLAEYPESDPAQRHRLTVSGIDDITVRTDPVPA